MPAPLILLLVLALATGPPVLSAQSAQPEMGFPILETRQLLGVTEGAETQTFDLTIDSQGRLVIGNLGGALIFDGAWWSLVPIGQAHAAFSVCAGRNGEIGVGGVDELGVVTHRPGERPVFRSLIDRLPAGERELGQVHTTRAHDKGYLFHSENWLHLWDGTRFHTLADLREARDVVVATQRAGTEVFVWLRESGLHQLNGTKLVAVPGGAAFRDRRIDAIVQTEAGLLISVRNEGLFRLQNAQVTPIESAASDWLRRNRALCVARLPDERIAIGSVLGGLLIMNSAGEIQQVIDSDVGLADDLVTGAVLDRDGTLWVTLNEGLVRVETSSGLFVLDSRNGLKGSTYAMTRHEGDLWVGTSSGTYTTSDVERTEGEPSRFRRVDEIPDSGWSFLSLPGELLVGTDLAIYSVRDGRIARVEVLEDEVAYAMVPSRTNPDRIWLGLDDGLASMQRVNGAWTLEGTVKGLRGDVRTIVETADGTLWCGTSFSGHYRVRPARDGGAPSASLERFPAPEGDETYFYRIGERILATRGKSIYVLDPQTGALGPADDLNRLGIPDEISVLTTDSSGNIWMNTHPPSVAVRAGEQWTELRVVHAIPRTSVETILTEPTGAVWFGTSAGLIRYSGHRASATAALPAPVFSRITAGGEILPVAPDGESPFALESNMRRVRIEFSPLSLRPALRYQTRLLPVEEEWGTWRAEPATELTSLAPGEYTLEARTTAAGGGISPAASWSFVVPPPWYRTRWAMALWTILALLLINFYARHRSRVAAARAETLEHRVSEQTRELQQSVDDLERAKGDLERANQRLEELTMRDDLTQLANRRHFLNRFTEEWRRAHRHQMPLSVILLDLDYFKQVNDSRGHMEGDRCLQELGAFLSTAVRRSGEVVARYGGEEFAILLPNTTVDEARAFAEKLRHGIEELRISAGSAPGGIVTASLGVAGTSSETSSDPDKLLSQADQALYEAKRGGRNQVRAFASDSAA